MFGAIAGFGSVTVLTLGLKGWVRAAALVFVATWALLIAALAVSHGVI